MRVPDGHRVDDAARQRRTVRRRVRQVGPAAGGTRVTITATGLVAVHRSSWPFRNPSRLAGAARQLEAALPTACSETTSVRNGLRIIHSPWERSYCQRRSLGSRLGVGRENSIITEGWKRGAARMLSSPPVGLF